MDKTDCIAALSALGHETRLEVFRLLIRAGADGVIAGEIGGRLDVPQNTMSTHLADADPRRADPAPSARAGRSATAPTSTACAACSAS